MFCFVGDEIMACFLQALNKRRHCDPWRLLELKDASAAVRLTAIALLVFTCTNLSNSQQQLKMKHQHTSQHSIHIAQCPLPSIIGMPST